MRALLAFLFFAVTTIAARGETPAEWWQYLAQTDRYGIQADLVLLGFYDGLVDGDFGPRTAQAIERFQHSRGFTRPLPSESDLAELRSQADAVYQSMGMTLETIPAEGVAAYVPRSILTTRKSEPTGGVSFTSADGEMSLFLTAWNDDGTSLRDVASNLLAPAQNRTVAYSSIRENRVVISGREGTQTYYYLLFIDYPKVVNVGVVWSDKHDVDGLVTATFAASYAGRIENFGTPEPQLAEPAPSPSDGTLSTEGVRIGPFVLPNSAPRAIILAGDIATGAMLEFRRALKARPSADIIVLDSGGGSVNEGLLLAHEIAERGFATYVPANASCMSACAYVFFAGKSRAADGELGVHQIYGDGVSASDTQTVLSDVLDALAEFDVPQEVISVMLRTKPEEMHIFTGDEVGLLQLNRGLLDRAALFGPEASTQIKSTQVGDPQRLPERVIRLAEIASLREVLGRNGLSVDTVNAVLAALDGRYPYLPTGATLRLQLSKAETSHDVVPQRVSIYWLEGNVSRHKATVALTDDGTYAAAGEPEPIEAGSKVEVFSTMASGESDPPKPDVSVVDLAVAQNDTRVAIAGDDTPGFEYVGVWAAEASACDAVDQFREDQFAVITRSTFRTGSKTFFGNFGSFIGGELRLVARAGASTRVARLVLQADGGLLIDGEPFERCGVVSAPTETVAEAAAAAAAREAARMSIDFPSPVDLGM